MKYDVTSSLRHIRRSGGYQNIEEHSSAKPAGLGRKECHPVANLHRRRYTGSCFPYTGWVFLSFFWIVSDLHCVALSLVNPTTGKEADKSTLTEKQCWGETCPQRLNFPFCWTKHFLCIWPRDSFFWQEDTHEYWIYNHMNANQRISKLTKWNHFLWKK